MKYNKDDAIKVGDLVRVVNPIYKQDDGFEFIVSRIDEDGDIWGPEESPIGDKVFFAKELEIMLPADQVELKEVMDEEAEIQQKKDEIWELLEKIAKQRAWSVDPLSIVGEIGKIYDR